MPKVINKKKRKFKITTPGQVRDFEILVKNRRFQKYEEVTPKEEDAPANSVAGGGVDMAPNAGPRKPKIFLKRKRKVSERVDGRSKAYRQTVKRIKERQVRKQQKDVEQRFSQFSQQANPFREETDMSNNKYLETKDSSLESAVNLSVQTEILRPHDDKPTLTLPKNRYLEAKEDSLEYAAVKAIAEGLPVRPGAPKPAASPLPRQLKDPKKEKMVGTKSGTKVVDRGDPKYKGAPEHESVVRENGDHPDMDDHDEKDEVKGKLKGRKSFKQFQKKDKEDQDKDPVGKKQDDLDRDDEAQATRSKKRPTAETIGWSKSKEIDKMTFPTKGVKNMGGPKKKAKKEEAEIGEGGAYGGGLKDAAKNLKKAEKRLGITPNKTTTDPKTGVRKTTYKGKIDLGQKKEEIEMSPLMQTTIDELSKKTLGSYVKKASQERGSAGVALGQTSASGKQTHTDVKQHAGKMIKRQKGLDKAVDKLSKESKETETGDRDVGSSQYLKYTSDLTPGQGITNPQARKADVAKKIEQQRQRTAATGIDDANIPGHKPAIGMKALKQKFKASRYAVRQKQARQAIATPKKEDVDLDAIIAKKLPESAVNPMGAPSNAPSGRSVIGNTAPEKVSPVKGSVTSQASPSGSVPGESGIEKVMDKINRIVKSGHSEKIHDNVIDKDTASAIQSTYAKVNAANQEKMEKVMSKDAASMEKISKFSKKNA